MSPAYVIVDISTDTPLRRNQLAVFEDRPALSDLGTMPGHSTDQGTPRSPRYISWPDTGVPIRRSGSWTCRLGHGGRHAL